MAPARPRRRRRSADGQRRRPRGARPRARRAAVRLRPRPSGRERPRAPGRARPGGRPPRRPVRAQGVARPAGSCAVLRGLGAPGEPGQRRHRRLLARRGAPRARERLGARGDQPHRHERLRARPRRAARAPDPDQPRRGEPDRAARPAGARAGRSGSGSTRAPAPATRSISRTRASGRRSSGSPRTGSTTRSTPFAATALVVDTLHFHAGSGWLGDQLDGFEPALVSATALPRPAARRRLPDPRGQRRRRARAWSARDGERPVDLDAYAAVVARHLGPYDVTAAFEPGDFVMKDAARAAGRGRDGRAARRHDVRRPRHRLERQLLVLHLQVRAGDRPGQGAAAGAHAAGDDRRATSTRRATCSRRTTRSRTSTEGEVVAILERRAATSRRCRRRTACGRWGRRCTSSGRRGA